jgi:aryl-alcohol dehydrogenase-like predicted oxidoreductase
LSRSKPKGPEDFRAYLPRFSAANDANNARVVAGLETFARARSMTPAQVAIAWVRAKQPTLIPLLGARTVVQVEEAVAALAHPLSAADMFELETLIPNDAIAGTRYPEPMMQHLDSER